MLQRTIADLNGSREEILQMGDGGGDLISTNPRAFVCLVRGAAEGCGELTDESEFFSSLGGAGRE